MKTLMIRDDGLTLVVDGGGSGLRDDFALRLRGPEPPAPIQYYRQQYGFTP